MFEEQSKKERMSRLLNYFAKGPYPEAKLLIELSTLELDQLKKEFCELDFIKSKNQKKSASSDMHAVLISKK